MAKKNFSTAGMDILGLRQQEEGKEEADRLAPSTAPASDGDKEEADRLRPLSAPASAKDNEEADRPDRSVEMEIGELSQPEQRPQQTQLVRKSYYVTPSQHRALKMKAASSEGDEDKDISTIIRAAIDMYLARG